MIITKNGNKEDKKENIPEFIVKKNTLEEIELKYKSVGVDKAVTSKYDDLVNDGDTIFKESLEAIKAEIKN